MVTSPLSDTRPSPAPTKQYTRLASPFSRAAKDGASNSAALVHHGLSSSAPWCSLPTSPRRQYGKQYRWFAGQPPGATGRRRARAAEEAAAAAALGSDLGGGRLRFLGVARRGGAARAAEEVAHVGEGTDEEQQDHGVRSHADDGAFDHSAVAAVDGVAVAHARRHNVITGTWLTRRL